MKFQVWSFIHTIKIYMSYEVFWYVIVISDNMESQL